MATTASDQSKILQSPMATIIAPYIDENMSTFVVGKLREDLKEIDLPLLTLEKLRVLIRDHLRKRVYTALAAIEYAFRDNGCEDVVFSELDPSPHNVSDAAIERQAENSEIDENYFTGELWGFEHVEKLTNDIMDAWFQEPYYKNKLIASIEEQVTLIISSKAVTAINIVHLTINFIETEIQNGTLRLSDQAKERMIQNLSENVISKYCPHNNIPTLVKIIMKNIDASRDQNIRVLKILKSLKQKSRDSADCKLGLEVINALDPKLFSLYETITRKKYLSLPPDNEPKNAIIKNYKIQG